MENSLWKIYKTFLIFVICSTTTFCNKKAKPADVVRVGKLYPSVLCEKMEKCALEEIQNLGEAERLRALPYLPNRKNCIEDQKEASVLPTDLNDPNINDITKERLIAVESCMRGIELAECYQLEDNNNIKGCEELYNIGENSNEE